MAKSRKDHKKRALHYGESQRKYDRMYIYSYIDAEGKRRYIYSKDLGKLREKEKLVKLDQLADFRGRRLDDLHTRTPLYFPVEPIPPERSARSPSSSAVP